MCAVDLYSSLTYIFNCTSEQLKCPLKSTEHVTYLNYNYPSNNKHRIRRYNSVLTLMLILHAYVGKGEKDR